jgi:hypothetical protein
MVAARCTIFLKMTNRAAQNAAIAVWQAYSHSNINDAATPLIFWIFHAVASTDTIKNPSSATQLFLAASASVSGATGTNQASRSFTLLCW